MRCEKVDSGVFQFAVHIYCTELLNSLFWAEEDGRTRFLHTVAETYLTLEQI